MRDGLDDGTAAEPDLFEAAPVALCLLDAEGLVKRANTAFRDLLGRETSEIVGREAAALCADTDHDRIEAARRLREAARPGGRVAFGLRCTFPGGVSLPTRWTARRLADGDLIVEVRDDSDRRRRRRLDAAMAAATGAGVWEMGRGGSALSWSPRVFEIFGRDPALGVPSVPDTIGHYDQADRRRITEAVERLMETGESFRMEGWITALDGARRRIRVTADAAEWEGEPGRYFGTVLDVTEETARRERMRLLSAVSERTGNSVFIADTAHGIVWANPAFERLNGYALEEVRGRRARDFLRDPATPPEVFARMDAEFDACGQTGAELLNVARDGTRRWVSVDVQATHDETGAVDGFVTVETDISALKAADARLRAAEAEARRERERLESAVEALSDGFALWDAERRLVLCNARFREMYPANAAQLVPGVRFEDVLRTGLAAGQYAEAIGREEDWFRERLASHRLSEHELDQPLTNGRWLRVVERTTSEGGRVGLRVDITERKRQEEVLRAKNEDLAAALAARDAAERRFRDLAEVSSDWFWEQDAEMRFTYVSPGVTRTLGRRTESFIGRTREELENREATGGEDGRERVRGLIARRESFTDLVYRIRDRWVRISGVPFYDADGTFAGYRGTGADITALHRAAEEAKAAGRSLEATLDAIPDALIETTRTGRVSDVRPGREAAAAVIRTPAEGASARLADVLPAGALGPARAALDEACLGGRPAVREIRLDGRDGPQWFALTAVRRGGPDAPPAEAGGSAGEADPVLVLLLRDVTPYKRAEREMRRAALTDPLTGLPNRRSLSEHLDAIAVVSRAASGTEADDAAAATPGADGRLALMHLDLDRFKAVNDSFGHGAGDAVLLHTARVLRDETRETDFVARVGGDEFVVVMGGSDAGRLAAAVADRLAVRLSEPIAHGDAACRIGASIGIALWRPADGEDAQRALADADIALYEAKRGGRGRWRRFEPWMRRRAETSATLGQEIRAGLERDEFEAWLQPQVSLATGEPVGFEALIRWRHPERGLLTPDRFLFAAVEANLVARLDDRMLELATRALAKLRGAGVPAPQVGVNVSADRLAEPDLVDRAKWAVDAAGLAPSDVSLEIVESVLLDERARPAVDGVHRLAEAGFALELDDFGTGHASISTLRTLPVDRIKIDRGFVDGIDRDPELQMITGAIVRLGANLGLHMLAEGVEREEEARVMAEFGCLTAQGYLFGRPMPLSEIVARHAEGLGDPASGGGAPNAAAALARGAACATGAEAPPPIPALDPSDAARGTPGARRP